MEEYKGYRELVLNDDELSDFYAGAYPLDSLSINEYAFIYNNGELVDKICYQGETYRHVRYPLILDKNGDAIKSRNEYQACAIDLLQDKNTKVKLLRGVYGSGKDLLMTNMALSLLEKAKFKKIVFIRPNVGVANVPDIGFLKGDLQDKLEWTLGPLEDIIGAERIKTLMGKGALEMIPLIFIRGRSFTNSIVYVTEGQNINSEIAKLILSRVGEGSELWINGDTHQTDRRIFEVDNGLAKLIERLRGNPLFGYMYLPITERSAVANLANLLDD